MPKITTPKRVNDDTKILAIHWMLNNKGRCVNMTVDEIITALAKEVKLHINTHNIYSWKKYGIVFKPKKMKKPLIDNDAIQAELDRISQINFVLCNAIKDLYYQHNLPIPDQIKKLNCSLRKENNE